MTDYQGMNEQLSALVRGVPIHAGEQIVGVLDLDSPHLGRFTEEDRAGLEEFVRILEAEVW